MEGEVGKMCVFQRKTGKLYLENGERYGQDYY